MLTAAVRDLKAAYPDWSIDVSTPCSYLWDNNPNITHNLPEVKSLFVGYKTPRMLGFKDCDYHFAHAFQKELNRSLNISIPLGKPIGDIYLSAKDYEPIIKSDKPILLINAGYKDDMPVKQWPVDRFQEVVEKLRSDLTICQIGRRTGFEHHPHLDGVIDLVDQTPGRDIVRLMVQADMVLTGVSFPMHLCAAVNEKDSKQRKCVVIAGGREEPSWEQYPDHVYLNSLGKFGCCEEHGCWKKLLTGWSGPRDLQCIYQVRADKGHYRPGCMMDISVEEVIDGLLRR